MDARLAVLERQRDEQRAINERLTAQIDILHYNQALLMKKNPDVLELSRGRYGGVQLAGDVVCGAQSREHEWVWIDGRASGIAEGAFRGSSVSAVRFSDSCSVKVIGSSAFRDCKALKYFEVPRSVAALGTGAFRDSALASIAFANDAALTTLGDLAFSGVQCESIDLPPSLTTIGRYAFGSSHKLSRVSFGANSKLATIKPLAFCNCGALRSVELPAALVEVPGSCFWGCAELCNVTFSGSALIRIAAGAFRGCRKLQMVAIPASVKSIGAFAGQTTATAARKVSVDGVHFTNAPADLGSFQECIALERVVLCEGTVLSEIGERCFSGCGKLREIGAAPGLRLIGPAAFANCDALRAVPLGDATEQIGELACFGCFAITSVAFPATVRTIGAHAFQNCVELADVTFAEGSELSAIGAEGFAGCDELEALLLPSAGISIGKNAFPLRCAVTIDDPAAV